LIFDDEELNQLLKEVHTRENPYVFLMLGGVHRAAVFPGEALGLYDVEYSVEQFLGLIAFVKSGYHFTGYQTRDGVGHPETADPSLSESVTLDDLHRLAKP
jgi:hypothetical protein